MTIQDLKNQKLILFEAIVGSKAYGLATDESDTDIKGVFYLPKDKFFGMEYISQVNNSTNDEVYYELGRFVELLSKSNPNTLELLASPEDCILHQDPLFKMFDMESLVTRELVETFANYAMAQVKKAKGLNKKVNNPLDETRKNLLDFCFVIDGHESIALQKWLKIKKWNQKHCGLVKINHSKGVYALFYDTTGMHNYKGILLKNDSQEVSCSSVKPGEVLKAYLFVNQDAYSSYCKSYKEYFEWVKQRNESRYQGTLKHGGGYDAKNMMHTIRLLDMSKEILQYRKLNVRRPDREELLKVKKGTYTYEKLYEECERSINEINSMLDVCAFAQKPDISNLESILVKIRKELYK
ncbi:MULTISPECIES: DNA polymerase beta superfamily protein [unclassified Sphingobacterium]|uniref:DNA polymerase beta superfamily protein n=1 Tax=unclassified Sphingobacterium TaxID=2609468 RepID=UPI0025D1CAC3|nr:MULTISPECIES: nucleotidyltransferase domain-containing protein [unclassified Sphingobacterium]